MHIIKKNHLHKLVSLLALSTYLIPQGQTSDRLPDMKGKADQSQGQKRKQTEAADTLYQESHQLQDFKKAKTEIEVKDNTNADLIAQALQKIENFEYLSPAFKASFIRIPKEEIMNFDSHIKPDDPMFDAWVSLILIVIPKDYNFDNTLKAAKAKAEQENATPQALNNLGIMYKRGQGIEIDLSKTREMFEKAALQGHALSQYNFGMMCHAGHGGLQDLIKAREMFEKAALQGHAPSQFNFGIMCYKGQGGPVDLPKAREMFEKSALQGHVYGQNNFSRLCYEGRGGDKDLPTSLHWLLKAINNPKITAELKIFNKSYVISLVNFVPSVILSKDEAHMAKNHRHMRDNINDAITTFEPKIIENDPHSNWPDAAVAMPALMPVYENLVRFERLLLNAIEACDESGFMVTCLQPKDLEAFKSSENQLVKEHVFKNQRYLTFGAQNIKVADELMTALSTTSQVRQAHDRAIAELIRPQQRKKDKYISKGQDIQNRFKLIKPVQGPNLEESPKVTEAQLSKRSKLEEKAQANNQLIDAAVKEIEFLTMASQLPQQMEDLLIEGASYRNKKFLNDNPNLEAYFQN